MRAATGARGATLVLLLVAHVVVAMHSGAGAGPPSSPSRSSPAAPAGSPANAPSNANVNAPSRTTARGAGTASTNTNANNAALDPLANGSAGRAGSEPGAPLNKRAFAKCNSETLSPSLLLEAILYDYSKPSTKTFLVGSCTFAITRRFVDPTAILDPQGLVAFTKAPSGKAIILVLLRGSEPSSWKDWKQDLQATPVVCSMAHGPGATSCGKVHSGFQSYFAAVAPGIRRDVEFELNANNWNAEIVYTGHSLGGAMATLGAYDMTVSMPNFKRTGASASPPAEQPKAGGPSRFRELRSMSHRSAVSAGSVPISVVTFGSPRVGDEQFAKLYDSRVPNTQRFVNYYVAHSCQLPKFFSPLGKFGLLKNQDLVTLIPVDPPFKHVGKEMPLKCPLSCTTPCCENALILPGGQCHMTKNYVAAVNSRLNAQEQQMKSEGLSFTLDIIGKILSSDPDAPPVVRQSNPSSSIQ